MKEINIVISKSSRFYKWIENDTRIFVLKISECDPTDLPEVLGKILLTTAISVAMVLYWVGAVIIFSLLILLLDNTAQLAQICIATWLVVTTISCCFIISCNKMLHGLLGSIIVDILKKMEEFRFPRFKIKIKYK